LIIPVILSGGSGTRLWPSSRTLYPKQLLALHSTHSMLQETVLRVHDMEDLATPIIICNEEHRFIIAEQLQQISLHNADIILEPGGRNTAPAATIAALFAKNKHKRATLLVLPADHLIQNKTAFQDMVRIGNKAAHKGALVTFGVKPTQPETGFGYIQQGKAINTDYFTVKQFVEKPDLPTAKTYIQNNDYWWNSGMFMFDAGVLIAEAKQHAPTILTSCQQALDSAQKDLDFVRLDAAAFAQCPADSIDYAIMEKTHNAVVVPFHNQWSDLGSWSSLWEVLPKDDNNNVLSGDVLTEKVSNSYIRADNRLVAAIGMDNHIIIETDDAVLVANKDHSQDVKQIVDQLKQSNRQEPHIHSIVYRPWGHYQTVDQGERFQVKRIHVKPGAKLSLQMHYHRAEHWIVVTGTAKVTRGDDEIVLSENESTYIPVGTKHRLENPTKLPLEIIEVQSGSYLGEDDIVRYDDDYQRHQ
jgi:mannose-1-phosphate guanylyltransferase / mannose-6-phosphate isomerase